MSVTIPIVSTPDVLGGKPRVEGTRVGVHQIGGLVREQGWALDTVAAEFGLSTNEIEAALEYYDSHLEEMTAIQADARKTYEQLLAESRATE